MAHLKVARKVDLESSHLKKKCNYAHVAIDVHCTYCDDHFAIYKFESLCSTPEINILYQLYLLN